MLDSFMAMIKSSIGWSILDSLMAMIKNSIESVKNSLSQYNEQSWMYNMCRICPKFQDQNILMCRYWEKYERVMHEYLFETPFARCFSTPRTTV